MAKSKNKSKGNKNKEYVSKSNLVKNAVSDPKRPARGAKAPLIITDDMMSGSNHDLNTGNKQTIKPTSKSVVPQVKVEQPSNKKTLKPGEVVRGKVKWFDVQKGYGFIIDEHGNEVFVHYTNITSGKTYVGLDKNDTVEFAVKQGEKGIEASDVFVTVATTKDDK